MRVCKERVEQTVVQPGTEHLNESSHKSCQTSEHVASHKRIMPRVTVPTVVELTFETKVSQKQKSETTKGIVCPASQEPNPNLP